MKKTGAFCVLVMCAVFAAAQSDTTDSTIKLRQLKEKQEQLNREMKTLEENIRAGSHSRKDISYESDWPMQEVTARLLNKRTGKPGIGVRCYLAVAGNNFELRTAVTDSNGVSNFLLQHVYSVKPMIFETDPAVDSLYRFEVGDPFEGKKFSRENELDSLAFFGQPDKRYMLDDYVRFPTLEEVLIEYVPEVRIRKSRGHYAMEVLNIPYKTFFEEGPVILLDGVPVFNLDALMSIDPLKIKKLEVMARKYYYGSMAWNGIVSFSSYDGDLAGYPLHENAVVKEYKK